MLLKCSAVMLGGALGALIRFLLSQKWPIPAQGFFSPGILIANLIGAFLIGLISEWSGHDSVKAFLIPGFLGALTTFSTWMLEVHHTQNLKLACASLLIHLIPGILLLYLGILLGEKVFS